MFVRKIWRTLLFVETASGGGVVDALILLFESVSGGMFVVLSVVVKRDRAVGFCKPMWAKALNNSEALRAIFDAL